MISTEKMINLKYFNKGKRINRSKSVYKIEREETNEIYVAKIFDCHDDEEEVEKLFGETIEKVLSIRNPSIIQIFGYSKVDFQNESNLTLIMEFESNGSLADAFKKIEEEKVCCNFTKTVRQINLIGISNGMKYLHENNFIHSNLKPSNILLDCQNYPYITGFFRSDQTSSQNFTKDNLPYMAPEILMNKKLTEKVDVYSFGVIMYEILTMSKLFPSLSNDNMSILDFKSKIVQENYLPNFDNKQFKDVHAQIIKSCLSKNPDDRPSFEEIFNTLINKDNFLDKVHKNVVNKYIGQITSSPIDLNEQLLNEVKKLESENLQIEKEIEQIKKENDKQKEEMSKIKDYFQQIKKENEELDKDNKEKIKQIEEIRNMHKKIRSDIEQVKKDYKEKLNLIDEVKKENQELNQEIKELEKNESIHDDNQKIKTLNEDQFTIENLKSSQFNNLPLQKQQLIAKSLSNKATFKMSQLFKKIDKLCLFLLKSNQIKESAITLVDDSYLSNLNDDICIQICSNATEILFQNNYLNSSELINILNEFQNISIEIKYPSSLFENIYQTVIGLKNSCPKSNLFSIFATGMKESDKKFQNNKYINYFKFDNTLHTIRTSAFSGCSSLIQISIPSSLILIGDYAFSKCSSLKKITIPSSVTSIKTNAFAGCSSLAEILFESPSSITIIGNDIFSGCSSLTQISIPSSVTKIGNKSFSECSSLTQISIPSSVTEIGSYCFEGCSSLSHISFEFPSSLTDIGEYAFSRCKLTKISIPSSVDSIGKFAFWECTSLSQIFISSSLYIEDIGLSPNVQVSKI